MTAIDAAAALARFTPRALTRRFTPALFAATLFVSALLLFAIQPMFTKMVLPRLGGSPSVWSIAMVAFQTFLFIGYVYAHLLTRALSPRRAALVHLAFLALVASSLPLGIAKGFDVPPADGVMIWLVGLFAASIGLPFIMLSATAPLLQNWFIATGHPQASNPYVLYAASNLGSFFALMAYPFVLEPFLSLRMQGVLWSSGYAVLAVGICVTALLVVRPVFASLDLPSTRNVHLALRHRILAWFNWTLLMAVPAGLCIAVTAFITTDLAAAPFFWVLPLALYLLTFVGVFRERPWISHTLVRRLLPYVIAPLAISMLGGNKVYWFAIVALNLVAFVLIALACHGEAYIRRPEPGRLTEFYLWTSFGGVIGGVFAGLIAPNVFNNIYEYPILIAAALLAMPGMFTGGPRVFVREAAPPLIVAGGVIALRMLFDVRLPVGAELIIEVLLVMIAGLMLIQAQRPRRFFGYVVLAFVITALWQVGVTPVETARSFFGVNQVVETADGTPAYCFTAPPFMELSACATRQAGRSPDAPFRSPTTILAARFLRRWKRRAVCVAASIGSRPLASGPAAWPATNEKANDGRFSRSILWLCGWPATRKTSASFRSAGRSRRSYPAMRGSRSRHHPTAMT
jgi:hypothetical protein